VFILILALLVALAACWYFGCAEKYFPGVCPKSPWVKQPEQ
jgi:hypothetical protein